MLLLSLSSSYLKRINKYHVVVVIIMSTFEEKVNQRFSYYTEEKARLKNAGAASDSKEMRDLEADEISYMLEVAPYIASYTSSSSERPGGTGVNETSSSSVTTKSAGLDAFVQVNKSIKKASIFNEYLLKVEKQTDNIKVNWDIEPEEALYECSICNISLIYDSKESVDICPSCGRTQHHLTEHLTYDQEQDRELTTQFTYRRINHFSEWLGSLRSQSKVDIPQEVLDKVAREFKKNRVTKQQDITPIKVREHLKRLQYSKYYEQSVSICSQLNGTPAPEIDSELEAEFRRMFCQLQEPFQKHIPKNRKNFLSYSYTLYKFSQLVGRDDLLVYFTLLKSKEKLFQQDIIFKKCCQDLGWEFIPSV
jgi:rubrerythrin